MAGKTADKGLGWHHEQAVKHLKQRHKDGSQCEWCGRPMWLDATKNPDYDPNKPGRRGNGVLQGDHSKVARSVSLRRGEKPLPPDRLLHAECNRQRGAGFNDHLAAVNAAPLPSDFGTNDNTTMPWPWT